MPRKGVLEVSARNRFLLCVLLSALIPILPAGAAITWNVTYLDLPNQGFNDSTFGAARRATVDAVLAYINTVVDESGTVDLEFQKSETDGTDFLASAGAFYPTSPNGFYNGAVFVHATTGSDPFGSSPDAEVTFDFGYTWNSEQDAPLSTEYDLFTVALHEITHAMGFASLVTSTGVSGISGGDPGVFSVYDSFLERGDGTALFGAGGDYLGTGADLTSGDVFFDGPIARAANGGNPVEVYAPGTYDPGSSISHIDTSLSGLMNHTIAPGTSQRTYADFEIGVLEDLGWTIVIPEVSGVLLLIPILGGGLCFHRRRVRVVREC